MVKYIAKIKNFFKTATEAPKVTLRKYQIIFTTADGIVHEGLEFKYGIVDRLNTKNIPRYIMIDIMSDGYIEGSGGVMYPLKNVIAFDWKLLDELVVYDIFDRYQVFVDLDEVEKARISNA